MVELKFLASAARSWMPMAQSGAMFRQAAVKMALLTLLLFNGPPVFAETKSTMSKEQNLKNLVDTLSEKQPLTLNSIENVFGVRFAEIVNSGFMHESQAQDFLFGDIPIKLARLDSPVPERGGNVGPNVEIVIGDVCLSPTFFKESYIGEPGLITAPFSIPDMHLHIVRVAWGTIIFASDRRCLRKVDFLAKPRS